PEGGRGKRRRPQPKRERHAQPRAPRPADPAEQPLAGGRRHVGANRPPDDERDDERGARAEAREEERVVRRRRRREGADVEQVVQSLGERTARELGREGEQREGG